MFQNIAIFIIKYLMHLVFNKHLKSLNILYLILKIISLSNFNINMFNIKKYIHIKFYSLINLKIVLI